MDRDEALAVLNEASWTYHRRISPGMPFPAAITDYPGMSVDILKDAGIDISGNNGEGVAVLESTRDTAPTLSAGTAPLDEYARQAIAEELADDGEFETGATAPRHAVFGRKNLNYMNEHNIQFGQDMKHVRLDLPEDDGGMAIG